MHTIYIRAPVVFFFSYIYIYGLSYNTHKEINQIRIQEAKATDYNSNNARVYTSSDATEDYFVDLATRNEK